MQDLVRIGVADAAEQTRIGERALERMVLALHAVGELLETGYEDVEAAGVHRGERRLAFDEVERSPALGARFGERERPVREFEGGKRGPPRGPRVPFEPAQPASDHEMQDEKEVPFELDDDALAHSPDSDDFLTLDGGDRRRHAAQHEGIQEPHALESLPDKVRLEMLDVHHYVRQLRHLIFRPWDRRQLYITLLAGQIPLTRGCETALPGTRFP